MACKTLQPIVSSAARRLSCSPLWALSLRRARPSTCPDLFRIWTSSKEGIEVACLAVNDPFVMKAWGEAGKADGITMLADGNGTFTKALGLEMDGTDYGLGTRAQRLRFTPKTAWSNP